jgi:hypothetical protein
MRGVERFHWPTAKENVHEMRADLVLRVIK